jgi:hypothetical protein
MTDRVQPGAIDSIIRNDELAQVFAQFSEGWIKPGSRPPSTAAVRRPEIDETALNAFGLVATSGFDITIDAGEGFVGGWCARDTQTTITVPGNATSTVVLAWSLDAVFDPNIQTNRDLADKVRVDIRQNVDSQYPSTELFDVTADSTQIVGTTDLRRLGPTVEADAGVFADSITDPSGVVHTTELADVGDPVTDFGPGTVADGEFVQNVGGALTGGEVTGNLSAKTELSGNQSLPRRTVTKVEFDTTIIEQDASVLSVDTSANEILIKQPGTYLLIANFEVNQNREPEPVRMTIQRGPNTVAITNTSNESSSNGMALSASKLITVSAADTNVSISVNAFAPFITDIDDLTTSLSVIKQT